MYIITYFEAKVNPSWAYFLQIVQNFSEKLSRCHMHNNGSPAPPLPGLRFSIHPSRFNSYPCSLNPYIISIPYTHRSQGHLHTYTEMSSPYHVTHSRIIPGAVPLDKSKVKREYVNRGATLCHIDFTNLPLYNLCLN